MSGKTYKQPPEQLALAQRMRFKRRGEERKGVVMTKRVKMVPGSGNVFRDIGFPEGEVRNLALRSEIMIRIEEFVERSGMTQARVAEPYADARGSERPGAGQLFGVLQHLRQTDRFEARIVPRGHRETRRAALRSAGKK